MSETKPKAGRPLGSKNAPGHSAGRPPLSDAEPTERHMILMSSSWWRYVEELSKVGESDKMNRSLGIRLIVEDAMRK